MDYIFSNEMNTDDIVEYERILAASRWLRVVDGVLYACNGSTSRIIPPICLRQVLL